MGTGGFFPWEPSGWGVILTTHLDLALRLMMGGAIPLLPLHAFIAWAGETPRSTKNLKMSFYVLFGEQWLSKRWYVSA